MNEPDILFTGSQIAYFRGFVVYALFSQEKCIYVGMSCYGISRPLAPNHKQLKDIKDDDVLKIWKFDNCKDAAAFEIHLVKTLKPTKNWASEGYLESRKEGKCKNCGDVFVKNSGQRIYCSDLCRAAYNL